MIYFHRFFKIQEIYSFHYSFQLLAVYRHAPVSVVDLSMIGIAGAGHALQSPTQFQRHSPVDGINFFQL